MPTAGYGAALWRGLKSFTLLRESWVGMLGAFLVLFWVTVAILAPLLAPFDPNSSIQPFAKPGMEAIKGGGTFWLGTDHIGRDILSRIIWGSRTVLILCAPCNPVRLHGGYPDGSCGRVSRRLGG